MQLEEYLSIGCKEMDLALSPLESKRLIAFLSLLQKWNQVHHFTAIRTLEEMISLHLLDSLGCVPYVTGNSIADVGTGPGLPGIPLAFYFPLKKFFLIEPNEKRLSFLRHARAQFDLQNIEIIKGRVPHLRLATKMDQVLSRAFAALPLFVESTASLLTKEGSWLAFKARLSATELEQLPLYLACQSIKVQLPYAKDRERHLLLIRRRSIMEERETAGPSNG